MSAVLTTDGLTVRYGGVVAVDSVDISVEPGTLVGLIGPNGAGKTSLIDALTGYTPSTGSVRFLGEEIQGHSTHRRVHRGLSRTFQSLELFEDLTVRGNVAAASKGRDWLGLLPDLVGVKSRDEESHVEQALELLGLTDSQDRLPTAMSLGRRKLVAVARALATNPRLLLLDEPAAGLDSDESVRLGEQLREMVNPERSILLVDHDMGLVLGVCDHIHVLDFGAVIASGTPDEIRRDPRVIAAYLGVHGDDESTPVPSESGGGAS